MPTIFGLVVDDFCVQYSSMDDANHFLDALKAKYPITVDMEANIYIGILLQWDYLTRTVILSMRDYVCKALQKFQHILPNKAEYAPYEYAPIQYGQKFNIQIPQTLQKSFHPTKSTWSNKFVAPSCTTPSPLTTQFF